MSITLDIDEETLRRAKVVMNIQDPIELIRRLVERGGQTRQSRGGPEGTAQMDAQK